MDNPAGIDFSIILRVVGGAEYTRRCLEALIPQTRTRQIEVIVPFDSLVTGIDAIAGRFPDVKLLDLGQAHEADLTDPGAFHDRFDILTAAGMQAARGRVLAIIEDYTIPNPDWCEQILFAHRQPYAAIGGAVEHAGQGVLNWAIYFLDFGRYQLPLRTGAVSYLTDVNISYKRSALESIHSMWAYAYNEVTVNWSLQDKGQILWLQPQIIVQRDHGPASWLRTLGERYYWGRIFGRKRCENISRRASLGYLLASPIIPVVVIARLFRKALHDRRNRRQLITALPAICLCAWTWALGEFVEYFNHLRLNLNGMQKEFTQ